MSSALLGTAAPIRLGELTARRAAVLPSGTAAAVREFNARDYALRRRMDALPEGSAERDTVLLELTGRVLSHPDGTPFDAETLDAELGEMTPAQILAVHAVAAGRANEVMAAIDAYVRVREGAGDADEDPPGNGDTPAAAATPTESDSTPTPSS
jgi:hypothetical protein